MQIATIQSYLVPPGKGVNKPPVVVGTEIPQVGHLFEMLAAVFNKSDSE
jgi:hypothetical protein